MAVRMGTVDHGHADAAQRSPSVRGSQFDGVDTNHDGIVDVDEFAHYEDGLAEEELWNELQFQPRVLPPKQFEKKSFGVYLLFLAVFCPRPPGAVTRP